MKQIVVRTDDIVKKSKPYPYYNVILGTGAMARDMRRKLCLLGFEVMPYLYGGTDNEAAGVRHYERMRDIENPELCVFHLFYDSSEWRLIAPSRAIINEITGVMTGADWLIGPIIEGSYDYGVATDIFGNIIHSVDGKYFVRHGDYSDKKIKIQIMGGSGQADILALSEHSMGESLYSALNIRGVSAVVDVYAQWTHSVADNIPRLLHDGITEKPDVVCCIFFNVADALPLNYVVKNALAVDTLVFKHTHTIGTEITSLVGEASLGIDFGSDFDIELAQHRIVSALSRVYGFKYYAVIHPYLFILPENKNKGITIRSPQYIARLRKRKDKFVSEASRYGKVIDLSSAFNKYDNIFPFYMDDTHLTSEGNAVAANLLAAELIKDWCHEV